MSRLSALPLLVRWASNQTVLAWLGALCWIKVLLTRQGMVIFNSVPLVLRDSYEKKSAPVWIQVSRFLGLNLLPWEEERTAVGRIGSSACM